MREKRRERRGDVHQYLTVVCVEIHSVQMAEMEEKPITLIIQRQK